MKRFSLPVLGLMLVIASCQKNSKDFTPDVAVDETSEAPARQCASHEVLEEQLRTDPQRAVFLEELERKTEAFAGRGANMRTGSTLYIPVVVNVVLPNAGQVSDAQIQRQLDVLNKDFNRANSELGSSSVYLAGYSYASVANCNIQFRLAPGTSIVRKSTSSPATFGTNDAVKKSTSGGINPTSPTTTLNIWVCDLSSGLLGYAQFPGGPSATDGVVIDYQAFGTAASYPMYSVFNLGRTATHEVGHWLNLRHIWGDARCGNDQVGDTPAHDDANGGCPSSSLRSRCSGKPLEQWMNYMDYTDDRCMYMFTAGQKTRMDAALDGARAACTRTASW